MPTVSYMIPQQGFRPSTNPGRALAGLRGIGVRGLGSGASSSWDEAGYVPGYVNPDPTIAAEQTNPDSCSLWDWFMDSCQAANKAQIQSVANNAAAVYGVNSPVAQVAQAVATQQEAQVAADTGNVEQFYSTGAGSTVGNLFGIPWWGWAIAGVVLWKELK